MANLNEQLIEKSPTWENIETFLSTMLGQSFDRYKMTAKLYWIKEDDTLTEAIGKLDEKERKYYEINRNNIEKQWMPQLRGILASFFHKENNEFLEKNFRKTLTVIYNENYKYFQEAKNYFRKLTIVRCQYTNFIGVPSKNIDVVENFIYSQLENKNNQDIIQIGTDSFSKEFLSNARLLITGIPGSGKTTLLKYLALKCSYDELKSGYIPIFVNLANLRYIEQNTNIIKYIDLKEYIYQDISKYTIIPHNKFHEILQNSQVLILLDGLEIGTEQDNRNVLNQIHNFIGEFPYCNYIISCNRPPHESALSQFTQLEIKNLQGEQIKKFINTWFKHKLVTTDEQTELNNKINNDLTKNPDNNSFPITPITLSFLCLKFVEWKRQGRKMNVEQIEAMQLYREALFAMIEHWDDEREHPSCKIYQKLPPRCREDLIGEIAIESLKLKKLQLPLTKLDDLFKSYLSPLLPNVNDGQNLNNHDINGILESIENQDGLIKIADTENNLDGKYYEFSHLIIRDYFAALAISRKSWLQWQELFNNHKDKDEQKWKEIFIKAEQLLEYRYKELKEFNSLTWE